MTRQFAKVHGLGSKEYAIEVNLSTQDLQVKETAENEIMFETLRRGYKVLLKKNLPLITNWIDISTRVDVEVSFSSL